jgi:hypothetical protein
MNDPIKYMLAGAGIAVVSGVLSAGGVAWALKRPAPNPVVRPGVVATAKPAITVAPASQTSFQQAQNRPEVKAAHEAYLEAQKKYLAAMQSVMGKQPSPISPPRMTRPPALPGSTTTNSSARVPTTAPSGR